MYKPLLSNSDLEFYIVLNDHIQLHFFITAQSMHNVSSKMLQNQNKQGLFMNLLLRLPLHDLFASWC